MSILKRGLRPLQRELLATLNFVQSYLKETERRFSQQRGLLLRSIVMVRHLILLVIVSFIVVIFLGFFSHLVSALHALFITVENHFNFEVGGFAVGKRASEILALIVVPLILAGLVYFVLWLIRRPATNMVTLVMWMTWLVLGMSLMFHA
jgi:hypothetical protein